MEDREKRKTCVLFSAIEKKYFSENFTLPLYSYYSEMKYFFSSRRGIVMQITRWREVLAH